jgi:hypothetical protein
VFFESDSELEGINSQAFFRSSLLPEIIVPRHVKVLGSECWLGCRSLSAILFERESELKRMEGHTFFECLSLKQITIPKGVEFIGGGAFPRAGGISILVDMGNDHFCVCGDFLCDANRRTLIWYFGSQSSVTVPRHFEVLGPTCFSYCESLLSLLFESGSELKAIGMQAFYNCSSLATIVIPRHVEVLESMCFCNCVSLSSVRFERGSELKRIGSNAFCACSALRQIVISKDVTIGRRAFPSVLGFLVVREGMASN